MAGHMLTIAVLLYPCGYMEWHMLTITVLDIPMATVFMKRCQTLNIEDDLKKIV